MNLATVQRGDRFFIRSWFRIVDYFEPEGLPDIARTIFVHSKFFGQPCMRVTQGALRGQSRWTRAERELIAAATSKANECPFCYGTHREIAATVIGDQAFAAIERSADNEGHRGELTAVLEYIDKLARDPMSVGKEDVTKLRDAGLNDEMIETAIYICAVFSAINRLANGLQFRDLSAAGHRRSAKFLNTVGYGWSARMSAIFQWLP